MVVSTIHYSACGYLNRLLQVEMWPVFAQHILYCISYLMNVTAHSRYNFNEEKTLEFRN